MKWRFLGALYYGPPVYSLHGSGEGNSVMRGDGYGEGTDTHSGNGYGNPHNRVAHEASRYAAVIQLPEDPA